MVSNKDITWIYAHIQDCHKQAMGLEKSILRDILNLFENAPDIPAVLHLRDDISDEKLTDLLKEASRNAIILPGGGCEPSVELLEPEKWIPVAERKPDKEFWEYQEKYGQDNMEVLVMIKGAKEATTLYYDDEGDFSDENGDTWLVTHWQPMPNPPKEEHHGREE